MMIFHSYVKLPADKSPSNPIRPSFSYGFPMVFQGAGAPPRLRYLDFVQGVTCGLSGQASQAPDGETGWFRRVDTKFIGENHRKMVV